jgi:excisionase family DNA binding protein
MTVHTPQTGPKLDKHLYRINEAMETLSMGKTLIYEQMNAGRLRWVKQGRSRLIPATAITDYIALLEAEAAAQQPA